jgi:hypothetical protein
VKERLAETHVALDRLLACVWRWHGVSLDDPQARRALQALWANKANGAPMTAALYLEALERFGEATFDEDQHEESLREIEAEAAGGEEA